MPRRPRRDGGGRRAAQALQRGTLDQRGLLERIMDTPQLAQVVPRLQPEVLHRVIQACGLEDCAALVALATPAQLLRVFDLDLWHGGRPGLDEQLDADRFGVWLEVLMEAGEAVAAQKLAAIDVDLVIAALAQHVLVLDGASMSRYTTLDGEEISGRSNQGGCEIGGYLVEPRRTGPWDAIVALLLALDAGHRDYFDRLMRGCRHLSNAGFELDGLDDLMSDREQDLFDVAYDREQRREKQGYVTPAQARAFLQLARQPQGGDASLPRNPIAGAYFRAIEWEAPASDAAEVSGRLPAASEPPPDPPGTADPIAAVVDLLLEAGVLPQAPRALLDDPRGASRLTLIQAHLQATAESNAAAFSMRTGELAFLANTIVAGCSIQARAFTVREASDAAAAVCNLGLENWPAPLDDRLLADHDLIGVFQAGWTVLHHRVCLAAAERLIDVLAELRCDNREIQAGLDALRIEMAKQVRDGTPWRARDALEVIMTLDTPAWAALVGLLDECPVIHAGMDASRGAGPRAVSATDFEFISENSQIVSVHRFFDALPNTLRGQ